MDEIVEPDLLAYAAFWDSGRFFEAHETLEPRWMRERDAGLQGLIQLAAALHHLSRGNIRGARTMLERCLARLSSGNVAPCRVDLARMSAYARRLRRDAGVCDAAMLIDARPRIRGRDVRRARRRNIVGDATRKANRLSMIPDAQFPHEQAADGRFVRQQDAFRQWVTADGRSGYPAVAHRYHLYVSLACPWAHRTIIMRALQRLDDAIGMTIVDPIRDDRGWAFRDGPERSTDPINGFHFLSEAYHATDPEYRSRVTVPVLWDTQTKRIVSNSDDDILRMFETEFGAFAHAGLDFYPAPLRGDIDALNERIYETVNDGVYRAGFATSQAAYEHAAWRLFEMLDELETRLTATRYLFGPAPVETDWRLFVTLVRFDAVYYGHFKCNLRRIADYPNLFGYLRDLYQIPGIAETVDFDHIKRHYYVTHDDINPTRIVPIGPLQDLHAPHGRERLG